MNCFDFCAHLIRYVVVNEKKSSRAIAVNSFINEQESMLTDQQFLSYSKLKNQGKKSNKYPPMKDKITFDEFSIKKDEKQDKKNSKSIKMI